MHGATAPEAFVFKKCLTASAVSHPPGCYCCCSCCCGCWLVFVACCVLFVVGCLMFVVFCLLVVDGCCLLVVGFCLLVVVVDDDDCGCVFKKLLFYIQVYSPEFNHPHYFWVFAIIAFTINMSLTFISN